jgi:hypothetical protein
MWFVVRGSALALRERPPGATGVLKAGNQGVEAAVLSSL